jgi:hypothetical protein
MKPARPTTKLAPMFSRRCVFQIWAKISWLIFSIRCTPSTRKLMTYPLRRLTSACLRPNSRLSRDRTACSCPNRDMRADGRRGCSTTMQKPLRVKVGGPRREYSLFCYLNACLYYHPGSPLCRTPSLFRQPRREAVNNEMFYALLALFCV